MLERATACLKAGARDSLKCAQHAKKAQAPPPASRRRLHSTFWTHGAGDFDVDIHEAGTALLVVSEGTTARNYIHPAKEKTRRGKERESTPAKAYPESPFLDFLYPPQALAWLQRRNGLPQAHHERRNGRRISEGFVQSSRDYSSRSETKPVEVTTKPAAHHSADVERHDTSIGQTTGNEPEEYDLESDNTAPERAEPLQGDLDTVTRYTSPQDPRQDNGMLSRQRAGMLDAVQMVRDLAPTARADYATEEATEKDDMPSDPLAAISPGDLSDQGARVFEPVANPLEDLRTIISGRRKVRSVDDVSRAWFLYTSLDGAAKADSRLMHELLLWFAKIDVETAQAHAISLFWSLPLEARSLTDYEAVLTAFLRRKTYDAVAGVHKEALRNIPNGHRITKKLFQHAVHHDNWQLALAVKDDLDCAFEGDGPAEARHQALFWINVAELPDLLRKAEGLVRKCLWFQRHKRKDLHKFTAFSARLSEEAFRQAELLAAPNWKPSQVEEQQKTRSLLVPVLDSIRLWNPNAPKLFEEFLIKLLKLNRSEGQYRQVHSIVSYIYGHYRKMQDVQFPERMLESLLSRVLPYASYLRELRVSKHSVSIEVIVEDWQKQHTILSCWAVKRLMSYYARQGMLGPLEEYYTYLKQHYPAYHDQKDSLWTLIYAHARRGESEKARAAFDRVDTLAKSNKDIADLKCWNILMHAYGRADDLISGLDTMSRMVDGARLLPDEQTIHPLLEMLARRGDADGIADLLQQYDSLTGGLHATSFVGSRMRALINSGEVFEAEQRLKEAVKQVRAHKISGSLTICFNIMISAYAQRRDLEGTMRTYRWMKAEKVWLDRNTYTGLMLVLIHFRQTSAAYTIMTKVMRKEGFHPTAIHYAIVMAGLVKQGLYDRVIWLHQKMTNKNIRPSLATRRNYLKALAMKEKAGGTAFNAEGEPAPLIQVIGELRDALIEHDGSEVASKDPAFGHDQTGGSEDIREHFVAVLFAHGSHRCFQATEELFRMHLDETETLGKTHASVPMRILVAMMDAHLRNGQYEQVEAYWNIAKDNADRIAGKVAIPDYQHSHPSSSKAPQNAIENINKESRISATGTEVDRAEIGFEAECASAVQESQTILPASLPRIAPRPTPGRKLILARPFRYFIRALVAQNRIADVLTTFTALVRQGYAFDIITWNRLIEYLCTSTPPLTLLAFTFTERYLIPNFPGWTPRYMTRRAPRKSAVSEGLQYIRGRYLSYDALAPQYRTMVYLTAALLKLRRMEATGSARTKGQIGKFVGTVRQIEALAPRTLEAVNSMPQVEADALQHKLLRSDEANEL